MKIIKTCLPIILALVLAWLFYVFYDVFLPFIIGGFLGIVIRKISNVCEKATGLSKKTSGIACFLIFYAVPFAFVLFLGKKMVCEIGDFIEYIPLFYEHKISPVLRRLEYIVSYINRGGEFENIVETIFSNYQMRAAEVVGNFSVNIAEKIAKIAIRIPNVLFGVVICIFTSFFVCVDYERICESVLKIMPSRMIQKCIYLKFICSQTILKMINSYFWIFLLTLLQLSLGLFLLNINHFFVISLIVSVLDIFPFVGTGCVLVPWAVIELLNNNIPLSIGIFSLFLIITVVRNIAEPKILGKNMGVHPLVSLALMYVGLKIGGFILAVFLLLLVVVIKQYFQYKTYYKSI